MYSWIYAPIIQSFTQLNLDMSFTWVPILRIKTLTPEYTKAILQHCRVEIGICFCAGNNCVSSLLTVLVMKPCSRWLLGPEQPLQAGLAWSWSQRWTQKFVPWKEEFSVHCSEQVQDVLWASDILLLLQCFLILTLTGPEVTLVLGEAEIIVWVKGWGGCRDKCLNRHFEINLGAGWRSGLP